MIHEAFIYSADEEFAAVLAPFLSEGVAAGQAAVAVTSGDRILLLRDALGADAASVSFFDAEDWYRRPGAALVAWRAALDEHVRSGVEFVRAVGEIVFDGDAGTQARWTRYESLINSAFAGRAGWFVCAYDARSLPDEILADARRTHPVVSTVAGRAPSPERFGREELGAALSPGADRGAAQYSAPTTVTPESDPIDLRRAVVWTARAAGIAGDVIEDLLLALAEIAGSAFASGRTSVTIRTARAGGEWFCELASAGRAAGELPPDESSLGFVIGRVIADRIEVTHGGEGSLVRLVFGTPRPDPRQRILAAAADLFAGDGVQATGVNAVIARAGVAKGTFYAHFPSKDDLVRTWLQSSSVQWFDGLRSEVEARAQSPAARLTLFFELLGEWLTADDFRGCQFLNTAAEAHDPDHPARRALGDLQTEVEEYFRSAAAEAGLADPDVAAAQLLLLVAGTITIATARRSADPAAAARVAAARLLASAER